LSAEENFWNYLDKIMSLSGLSKDLVFNQVSNIERKDRNISAETLLKIANNLKIDPISLWEKKINIEFIIAKFQNQNQNQNQKVEIQSPITQFAFSPVQTLFNCLNLFKKYHLYEYSLTKLQIEEKDLEKLKKVSINSICELFDFGHHILKKDDFRSIGEKNANYFFYQSAFKSEVFRFNEIKKNIETFFEMTYLIERNWIYKITKSNIKEIVIETWDSHFVQENPRYLPISNIATTELRIGFLKKLLELAGYQVVVSLVYLDLIYKNRMIFKVEF